MLKSTSNFGPINLVVNCAGIGITKKVFSKEELHSIKIFEKVVSVNLTGSFNVSKLAFNKMKDNPHKYPEYQALKYGEDWS